MKTLKRSIIGLVVLTCILLLGAGSKAQGEHQCSNASLRGAYGFYGFGTVVPAKTPRAVIGVFQFDGHGSWTATLTINDNGSLLYPNNTIPAPYIVNADCTGALFPSVGGRVDIVVVDGGREVYQMRTDPSTVVLAGVTKRVFPGNSD